MSESWISDETEQKEEDFRGILAMHVGICKGITSRYGGPPYLYADLFAGPGHLEHKGRRFLGSPLIARQILTSSALPHDALHFEKDPQVAGRLAEAGVAVNIGPCQDGFKAWLEYTGHQPHRLGLIYSDPIRDPIPHELLNLATKYLPKVDLLSYVSATQYKRRRGADVGKPFLADHIAAVDKRVVLIREPLGRQQWTFVLWSNWVRFPEWQRRGFYRLDSARGAGILERLNLSERESRASANVPLPLDEPYSSYAEYLKHPRFLAVRARVFDRARGVCERCKVRPPTEPHHLRYPPWGEFDAPENMIAVCHPCHCEIHGKPS